MGTKIMKQKETETVFDRRNYVILLVPPPPTTLIYSVDCV